MITDNYYCNNCDREFQTEMNYYAYLNMIEVTCPHCKSKNTEKCNPNKATKMFRESTDLISRVDRRDN